MNEINMHYEPKTDRRDAQRFEVSGLAYIVLSYAEHHQLAHIIDISETGFAILSTESLEKYGTEFEFVIRLYDDTEFTVTVKAKIVSSTCTTKGTMPDALPVIRTSFSIQSIDDNEKQKFSLLISRYCDQ
jgi:hypothetical protein